MNITEITDKASKAAAAFIAPNAGNSYLMVIHEECCGYDEDRPAREAMCAKAIELAKVSLWIPATERMPTQEEADPSGAVIVTDGRFQWREQADRSITWTNPTHWMPFVPPPQPTAEDKMREEFEAWWKDFDPRTPQDPLGRDSARSAWKAWQAARKSQNA
jgi:hypothetical protein